jgi:ADP-ribosylglycohydrolase
MTHKHPETIAGAIAIAYLVARAAAGMLDVATAIDDTVNVIGACNVAENLLKAQRLLGENHSTADALAEIGTSGWVVHTVAAATYCFLKTPTDFERSVIDAVMGGDDADTTGAVTGAISGAYNGVEAIPLRWRSQVERGDEIGAMAEELWRLVQ